LNQTVELRSLRLERSQAIMPTAHSSPFKEVVTAALLVIGGKILSGPIDSDPRALAILHEWMKTTGPEMNEARLPHDAHSQVRGSHPQQGVGGAFWIGNVIVMAGVPSIMQAMLDEVAPKLKIGIRMLSETVRADAREGDIGMQLGEIAKANPAVAIGSYPFFDPQLRSIAPLHRGRGLGCRACGDRTAGSSG
jgi:hypothetical protein